MTARGGRAPESDKLSELPPLRPSTSRRVFGLGGQVGGGDTDGDMSDHGHRQMEPTPAWIVLLFKRGHGLDAFRNRFLLDLHRDHVERALPGGPEAREQLRSAALTAINSEDRDTIIQGLAFLLVVGRSPDLDAVSSLVGNADEAVQKAAKTCRFELERKAK
jgi:hypothetical protein